MKYEAVDGQVQLKLEIGKYVHWVMSQVNGEVIPLN